MTNHVTPQTATRLKQAGFKQPEQKPGQFWYLQNRLYFIVAILSDTVGKTAILYEVCEENRNPDPLPVRVPFSDVLVYAPGVGEILQELGHEWGLSSADKDWYCDNVYATGIFVKSLIKMGASCAEPCAAVWMEKNAKL